jgi:hypothetical protein
VQLSQLSVLGEAVVSETASHAAAGALLLLLLLLLMLLLRGDLVSLWTVMKQLAVNRKRALGSSLCFSSRALACSLRDLPEDIVFLLL